MKEIIVIENSNNFDHRDIVDILKSNNCDVPQEKLL